MNKNYHLCTFGCQMNVNDSDWLAATLESRGFRASALEEADVVCVNTCSVREKPEQKVRQTVERIYAATKKNPAVLVVLLGCVAKQRGEECFTFSPQVRLVCAPDQNAAVPDLIEELLASPKKRIASLAATPTVVERVCALPAHMPPQAYVNIMQGCNNFCTYCIVPYTRGRQRSRDPHLILAECRAKVEHGAQEIILLGQNVNAYGKDKAAHAVCFADLLADIATIPGLKRLRYTSPHPKDMTEADILAFQRIDILCPSLHLPVQSGSDRILRAMGRGYTSADYDRLVQALYASVPSLALTTDIIVGFPGETEEDFRATLALMERTHFTASYSFCYSDRPGTRASGFADKIDANLAHTRLERLQALQDHMTERYLATRLGQTTTLLLEKKSKRTRNDAEPAPHIVSWEGRDPFGVKVHVCLKDTDDHTGELLPVTITEQGKHCLFSTTLDADAQTRTDTHG